MIVVVGSPVGRLVDGRVEAGGLAARAAVAAAGAGSTVQLVGRVGDDPDADRLLLALARAGVGHVAVLRDAARPTAIALDVGSIDQPEAIADAIAAATEDDEPTDLPAPFPSELDAADIDLGLRYLTDFRVVVLTPPADPELVAVAADAARWASARLVLVVEDARDGTGSRADAAAASLPTDAMVLQAPETDLDGAFAALVGRLAAALDAGADPATAFRDVISEAGWAAAPTDG